MPAERVVKSILARYHNQPEPYFEILHFLRFDDYFSKQEIIDELLAFKVSAITNITFHKELLPLNAKIVARMTNKIKDDDIETKLTNLEAIGFINSVEFKTESYVKKTLVTTKTRKYKLLIRDFWEFESDAYLNWTSINNLKPRKTPTSDTPPF